MYITKVFSTPEPIRVPEVTALPLTPVLKLGGALRQRKKREKRTKGR